MNLAAKIILFLLCILLFFMGGFTYLILRWQQAQFVKSTHHYSIILSEAVSGSIATEMELGRSDKVQGILERIGQSSPHIQSLLILDQDGRILRSANPSEVGKWVDPVLLESHLRHVLTPFEHQVDGKRFVSFIQPLPNRSQCQRCHDPKEKVIGFLDLDISLKPMEELISSSEKFLLEGLGITFLLLIGAILVMLSRWVRKPLSNVMSAMKKVEEGDLETRINLDTRDELGKVAGTFNSMVETLSKAKKDLEILHQREMEGVQRMATLGEMAAAVAHEVRNPLTGIGNALQIIRDGLGKDDPRGKIFDEIRFQINRLEKIVTNLLQFARTPAPRLSFWNIHELIEKTLHLFADQIQTQRIEVVREIDSALPPVHADEKKIQQALMNVILNAIQAMPKGGRLRFKTSQDPRDGMIHLTIGDTGVGIAPEILPKIFKPFYSSKAKGAGLGLAIVDKVIKEHRGRVTVSSEAGVGTTIELSLPTS